MAEARASTGPSTASGMLRGRIHNATRMNGTYDAALTAKAPVAPTLAISSPAIAGPRMRDRLNCVASRPSAAASRSLSTIEETIVWNDGIDNASVTPTTSDVAMTIHGI